MSDPEQEAQGGTSDDTGSDDAEHEPEQEHEHESPHPMTQGRNH